MYRAIIIVQMKKSILATMLVFILLILTACSLPSSQTPEEESSKPSIAPSQAPVPAVSGFFGTGSLSAANSEVVVVKSAAKTYHLYTGTWPSDSNDLVNHGYLDRKPKEIYTFDATNGTINGIASSGRWIKAGFSFKVKTQKWQ